MKTQTQIKIYEKNGKKIESLDMPKLLEPIDTPKLLIESHWNLKKRFVILKYNDIEITVNGSELIRAIENARNTV